MKYKINIWMMGLLLFSVVLVGLPVYGQTYLTTDTFSSDLIVTEDSDMTGSYKIGGNFVINSGKTLTIKGNTTIEVNGNITISGFIKTGGLTEDIAVVIKSNNGNIVIAGGDVTVTGSTGTTGINGTSTAAAGSGGTGKKAKLDIVAIKGNITINSPVTVAGGTGGRGGTGIGSSGSTDGGTGGTGGWGGDCLGLLVLAQGGRIDINSTLKSIGGTGGQGGTGGPDQSLIGGPGTGGSGGTGGQGAPITVAGQDEYFTSTTVLDVSGGVGGAGGAGGSGGTFGGTGTLGSPGGAGSAASAVWVKGGEMYNTSTSTPITTFPAVTVKPTTVTKNFEYDQSAPAVPDVAFPYNISNGEYYTNTTSPVLMIKNPGDNGFLYINSVYGTTIFKSGISYFTVTGAGSATNVAYPAGTGDVQTTLNLPAGTSLFNIVVTAVDKYNNKTASGIYKLHLDQNAPMAPILATPESLANGMSYKFSWAVPADDNGIDSYIPYISDVAGNSQTATSYTYSGQYNEQVSFYVQARDFAGNTSQSSVSQTVYTLPKSTSIKTVTLQNTADAGIQANVTFTSVGTQAAGYQIRVQQMDYQEKKVGTEIIRQIGAISTLAGQDYTHTIMNLKPEARYQFSIGTYNKNTAAPSYSWVDYATIVETPSIQSDPLSTRTLTGNENWSGTKILTGDVIVPQNITLTISPGTVVKMPTGSQLVINGTLICDGTTGAITFTSVNALNEARTNTWKGIYLAPTSRNSLFKNVICENARRGLTLNGQTLTISGSTFRNNDIGISLVSSTATLNTCRFEGNTFYGIKEEVGGVGHVYNSIFLTNGVAPYYSYTQTILNIADLNAAAYGSGNQ